MRLRLTSLLLALLAIPGLQLNAAPQDAARYANALAEIQRLESTQLQEVGKQLQPLLDELRSLAAKDALTAEISRVFQDALLLQLRTQVKLLAPEPELVVTMRELAVLNPKIDAAVFTPRERAILDKLRSSETGHLSLQTTPPGAELFCNGISLGKTPAELVLVAGTYRLALSLQGYRDQRFETEVHPNELLTVNRQLQRRTVEVPLAVNVAGATVLVNGAELGTAQPFSSWSASLPPGRREAVAAVAGQWRAPAAYGFLSIPEFPVGETAALEIRAACHQPLSLTITVTEQEVDWTRPVVSKPELRNVELKKETGFIEVSSNPEGAEVRFDGELLGKTPLGKDVCVGNHRLQVLHPAGQYLREIVVRRGQALRVSAEVKPALAFLGVYTQDDENGSLVANRTEWTAVSRQLALRLSAFLDLQPAIDDLEALRKKNSLPLEILTSPASPGLEGAILDIAARVGNPNLLLIALKSPDAYLFRLYSTIRRSPDAIAIPNLEPAALDFLTATLNKAEAAPPRLLTAFSGIEAIDTPDGLVVLKSPAGPSGSLNLLAPGSIIKSVDHKPVTYSALREYLATRKPGQTITFEVSTGKQPASLVPVQLAPAGAEYPWATPDGLPNAVLAALRSSFERAPDKDAGPYACLSLARGLMHAGEWKAALEYLGKVKLDTQKTGISAGTVLYYRGRCFEALGDRDSALSHYTQAKGYPDATVAAPDGPPVAAFAERRIQVLKKTPQ